MKYPKYREKCYALVFLYLSFAFLIMGVLCIAGITKPTVYSKVQDSVVMGVLFCIIGAVFLILQLGLRAISTAHEKLHNELLANGLKLSATVEKVTSLKLVRINHKTPFQIRYTYCHHEKTYHHKSHLIWDKPSLNKGDEITIYANNLGKSTLDF